MIVLLCYSLILHLLSFVVLHVKYVVLKGKLEPLTEPLPVHEPRSGVITAVQTKARTVNNHEVDVPDFSDTEVTAEIEV